MSAGDPSEPEIAPEPTEIPLLPRVHNPLLTMLLILLAIAYWSVAVAVGVRVYPVLGAGDPSFRLAAILAIALGAGLLV